MAGGWYPATTTYSPATCWSVALYRPDLNISTSVINSASLKWMYWLFRRGWPKAFLCLRYSIVSDMIRSIGVTLRAAQAMVVC